MSSRAVFLKSEFVEGVLLLCCFTCAARVKPRKSQLSAQNSQRAELRAKNNAGRFPCSRRYGYGQLDRDLKLTCLDSAELRNLIWAIAVSQQEFKNFAKSALAYLSVCLSAWIEKKPRFNFGYNNVWWLKRNISILCLR